MVERSCFVENGGIRIPLGYRFRPTNEELLIHYLRPKVLAIPFPVSVIPEFDVFQTDPWGLPGDLNEERRYFFSNHSKMDVLDGKCRRAAGSGYWKPTGKCKLIVAHQTVGIRKTLVFTQSKRPRGTETRWFMHQFCFLGPATTQVQDWAVYRLFQKKRKQKKQHGLTWSIKEEVSSPQVSCCSSGVTDQEDSVNVSALLDQEASSAYIDVFPSFSCMRNQD